MGSTRFPGSTPCSHFSLLFFHLPHLNLSCIFLTFTPRVLDGLVFYFFYSLTFLFLYCILSCLFSLLFLRLVSLCIYETFYSYVSLNDPIMIVVNLLLFIVPLIEYFHLFRNCLNGRFTKLIHSLQEPFFKYLNEIYLYPEEGESSNVCPNEANVQPMGFNNCYR